MLHLPGHGPLGPLPVPAGLAEWAARDPLAWLDKVDQHLFFVPDPGVLVYQPPGAELSPWISSAPGMRPG